MVFKNFGKIIQTRITVGINPNTNNIFFLIVFKG